MSQSNQLATRPAPMLPGLVDETHVLHLVDSFQIEQAGFRGPIFLNRMPTQEERTLLKDQLAELDKMLHPYGMGVVNPPCAARRGLAAVFRGIPALRNEDAADLIDAFMLVLQKYSKGAVLAAIGDMANGRLRNHDIRYAPNSVQVGNAAASHHQRIAGQRDRIEKILAAQRAVQVDHVPGVADRIAASLKDFHGRIAQGNAGALTADDRQKVTDRQRREGQEAVLREWADIGRGPMRSRDGMPISVGLAVRLGRLIQVRGRDDQVYYREPGETQDVG